MIAAYHPQVLWARKTARLGFYRDQTREWVFDTDARTFRERLNLVAERGIEGFCSWVLSDEDPAIWDLLPAHS